MVFRLPAQNWLLQHDYESCERIEIFPYQDIWPRLRAKAYDSRIEEESEEKHAAFTIFIFMEVSWGSASRGWCLKGTSTAQAAAVAGVVWLVTEAIAAKQTWDSL